MLMLMSSRAIPCGSRRLDISIEDSAALTLVLIYPCVWHRDRLTHGISDHDIIISMPKYNSLGLA